MKNITELIHENTINEAKMLYWFVQDIDEGNTYIVAASNAKEAKSLVKSSGEKQAWYLDIDKPATHAHVFFNLEEAKLR